MHITLRQLEVFVAIVKYANLTKAADKLFLSQSAASMALAQLESQLQSNLFERAGKRLSLNEHGKTLLPKAVEILERAKEIEQLAKTDNEKIHGELIVGASTTIGNYLMPVIITDFLNRHNQTKVKLVVNNTEQIINEVLQFTIDIGYIEGYCHHPNITVTQFQEDELIIVSSPKHPLARKRQLNLTDLNNVNWILREPGSGTREIFEKTIYNKLNNLNVILELGSTEAIKQALINGLGMSCLSKLSLARELKSKQLVQISTPFKIKRNLYQLIHKQKYLTPILKNFLRSHNSPSCHQR